MLGAKTKMILKKILEEKYGGNYSNMARVLGVNVSTLIDWINKEMSPKRERRFQIRELIEEYMEEKMGKDPWAYVKIKKSKWER